MFKGLNNSQKKRKKQLLKLAIVAEQQAVNGNIALAIATLATIEYIELESLNHDVLYGTGTNQPTGLINYEEGHY